MAGVTRSIGRSAIVLGVYGTLAAFLTVGIFMYTKDRIEQQRRLAKERALTQIVRSDQYDNQLLDDTVMLPQPEQLGPLQTKQAYIARLEQEPVIAILPVTITDGYSGDMRLIVGVQADGKISGVRVLMHNETPGLGDKVDVRKSNWISSFVGRSLIEPKIEQWAVKKDGGVFDQFTGATITPRAVVKGVLQALIYFDQHSNLLLAMPSGNTPPEIMQAELESAPVKNVESKALTEEVGNE